jgi:hypothetical protein
MKKQVLGDCEILKVLVAHVPHRYENDVAHLAHRSGRDGPKELSK